MATCDFSGGSGSDSHSLSLDPGMVDDNNIRWLYNVKINLGLRFKQTCQLVAETGHGSDFRSCDMKNIVIFWLSYPKHASCEIRDQLAL